ncbi:hypothetical protein QYF36_012749 [Acer negundo]|nr:hypothetical protein QYF36_012749 [Acer negundo]
MFLADYNSAISSEPSTLSLSAQLRGCEISMFTRIRRNLSKQSPEQPRSTMVAISFEPSTLSLSSQLRVYGMSLSSESDKDSHSLETYAVAPTATPSS